MIVASIYIFRRYRQEKISMMCGIGEDGYTIMPNNNSNNTTNYNSIKGP